MWRGAQQIYSVETGIEICPKSRPDGKAETYLEYFYRRYGFKGLIEGEKLTQEEFDRLLKVMGEELTQEEFDRLLKTIVDLLMAEKQYSDHEAKFYEAIKNDQAARVTEPYFPLGFLHYFSLYIAIFAV